MNSSSVKWIRYLFSVLPIIYITLGCSPDPPRATVEAILKNAYLSIVVLENDLDRDVVELLSEDFIPWENQLSDSEKVRLLMEIRAHDLDFWRKGDPWDTPLNIKLTGEAEGETGTHTLGNLHRQLRIWSSGANKIDEDGAGDDIALALN